MQLLWTRGYTWDSPGSRKSSADLGKLAWHPAVSRTALSEGPPATRGVWGHGDRQSRPLCRSVSKHRQTRGVGRLKHHRRLSGLRDCRGVSSSRSPPCSLQTRFIGVPVRVLPLSGSLLPQERTPPF